jgi:hypothetical protein
VAPDDPDRDDEGRIHMTRFCEEEEALENSLLPLEWKLEKTGEK